MIIANPIYDTVFSDEYQHIIRKLREACESKQIREEMQLEDDFINELLMKDEIIAEKEKAIEEKDKENKKLKNEIEELKRLYGIN